MEDCIVKDRSRQTALMALAAASIFIATLDYSMLNISLPGIAKHFNVKLITVSWVPLTYLLIITSSLLGFGKLGDIKGYRRLFISGIVVFLAGTLSCSASQRISWMLISRAIQSIGEAMYSPAAIALITTQLPEGLKGRALGIMALAQGLGLSIGPVLGGALNAYAGWRAIFIVNIPIGLAVVLLALRMLQDRQLKSADRSFDIMGAGLVFAALSTFLFALNSVTKLGFGNPVVLGCLAVSVISIAAFILRERRISYPLLDLSLFRNKDFSLSGASVFMATFVYMGMYFLLPFYLEMVRGFEVTAAGAVLMFPPIMMMMIAPFSGRLSDTVGSRIPCSIGMALAAIGSAMLIFLDKDTPFAYMAACQFVMGIAMGMFLAPNNRLVMASAPPDKQGMASGVYKTMLNIGSSTGLAASPIILMRTVTAEASRLGVAAAEIRNRPDIMTKGFRSVFIFAMFVCMLSFVFSMIARDRRGASLTKPS